MGPGPGERHLNALREEAWAAAFAAGRALSLEEAIAETLWEEAPVDDVADVP